MSPAYILFHEKPDTNEGVISSSGVKMDANERTRGVHLASKWDRRSLKGQGVKTKVEEVHPLVA